MVQTKLVKFKYADEGFDGSTAVLGNYQSQFRFRGNGPYDPQVDGLGPGVQPYGWDQFDAFFDTYLCHGSKIKVKYSVQTTSYTNLKLFVIPFQTATLDYYDVNDLKLTKFARYRESTWQSLSGRNNVVKNYCSNRKLRPDLGAKDETYVCHYSAIPETLWWWFVIFDSSSTGEEVVIKYDVEITYYCQLRRENNMNES